MLNNSKTTSANFDLDATIFSKSHLMDNLQGKKDLFEKKIVNGIKIQVGSSYLNPSVYLKIQKFRILINSL